MKKNDELIVVTGPTASGKTAFSVALADVLDGEVISADSRQVYRKMDIGTGKDLFEYRINGKNIPYHLIDICDAGEEYNVFLFKKDFEKAYRNITDRGKTPVLCGGTGLYIEAALKDYNLLNVPPDQKLRKELATKTDEELTQILKDLRSLHNISDTSNRKRLIRAVEIATYQKDRPVKKNDLPKLKHIIFAIAQERKELRKRITERLKERLRNGMIEEAESLIKNGVSKDRLIYYGLEYKYLAEYLDGQYNYNDMFQKLNSAIHRFAKRQMTWFRKMERDGLKINWIESNLTIPEKVSSAVKIIRERDRGLC